jgi:hypothetical protein
MFPKKSPPLSAYHVRENAIMKNFALQSQISIIIIIYWVK